LFTIYSAVDISGYGSISENEALKLCQQVSDKSTYDQIRTTIKECETNANGTIEIEEFFEVFIFL
jgi:plastin-1